jgi:hypothetical protein
MEVAMTDTEARTYVIEHSTIPTRWAYTTATWSPTTGLHVSEEVDYEGDESGPKAESEAKYQVPPERVPELLAAVPEPFDSVPALLVWASASSVRAATLLRALDRMAPPVMVFHRLSQH